MTSTSLIRLLAATFLAASLSITPQAARADISMTTSGGSACKPAYGASTKFVFTELYALNTGTTDQYLVCGFANWALTGPAAKPPNIVAVYVAAGTTSGTAACTIKMAAFFGTTSVASVLVRSATLQPAESTSLYFNGLDLQRWQDYQILSMNCKLPGGFKLGLIQRWEPEPPVGVGWTR